MNDRQLPARERQVIGDKESTGVAISVVSCSEAATFVQKGRLELRLGAMRWVETALTHPSVRLATLTPRIAVQSTLPPDWDYRGPADRIIVATARAHACCVLTADARILAYPHVWAVQGHSTNRILPARPICYHSAEAHYERDHLHCD